MSVLPSSISRSAKVAAICGAALVLTVPPAVATVMTSTGPTSVVFTSDGDGDTINVTCQGGQVRLNGGANVIACNVVTQLVASGNDGNDNIDLSALQAADFPQLATVSLDGGSDVDNVKGSFFGDDIDADSNDTVQGFGGNDIITSGDSVFGGDGDDILQGTQGAVEGGSGDDRLIEPGSGPYDGGTGYDSLETDFAPLIQGIGLNFVVSDAILHIDAPALAISSDASSVGIERYVIVMPTGGTHTWSSTAYSGDTRVVGAQNADKFVGGPGEDFVDGRAGNDELTGGAGFDHLAGGAGDDLVNSRDGAVDRVICGDGNDTVVADAGDVVTACETVQLPPAPPPPPPPAPVVPVTGAVKGPKTVEQGVKAKFTFTSATVGATFQCKVDKKAWKACKSPLKVATKNLKASKDGTKHVLKVRAVLAGVVDKSPSKKSFKVTKPE